MNLDEERYLEYWEKREKENIEQFECFEHSRKIIVISEDGELEELKVEGYHFETLYERFKVYEGADEFDEYVTSSVAAKNGFIVFILDTYSLSMFYPSSFTFKQKETLLNLLNTIPANAKVYASIIDNTESINMIEWNNGEEILNEYLKTLINEVPLKGRIK